jgi:hypothetical protein
MKAHHDTFSQAAGGEGSSKPLARYRVLKMDLPIYSSITFSIAAGSSSLCGSALHASTVRSAIKSALLVATDIRLRDLAGVLGMKVLLQLG